MHRKSVFSAKPTTGQRHLTAVGYPPVSQVGLWLSFLLQVCSPSQPLQTCWPWRVQAGTLSLCPSCPRTPHLFQNWVVPHAEQFLFFFPSSHTSAVFQPVNYHPAARPILARFKSLGKRRNTISLEELKSHKAKKITEMRSAPPGTVSVEDPTLQVAVYPC